MIELTRQELCILYVIKLMNQLVDEGILENKPLEINPDYLPLLDNFVITEDELETVFRSVLGYLL